MIDAKDRLTAKISLPLSDSTMKKVLKLAAAEKRKPATMARILIEDSLASRGK